MNYLRRYFIIISNFERNFYRNILWPHPQYITLLRGPRKGAAKWGNKYFLRANYLRHFLAYVTWRRYFINENEIKPPLKMNYLRGTFPILGTSAEVIRAEIIHSAVS